METTFPVGGSRQAVYDFLQSHGFIRSKQSDKIWNRADGLEVQVYGTGSCARVVNKEDKIVAQGPLKETIEAL